MECYDIAVAIGENCQPAFYLKIFGLRNFANPMDWNICRIKNQVKIYENKFEDFFLNYVEDINTIPIYSTNYRVVKDLKNDIVSMHHVSKEVNLNEAMNLFKSLMKKRYYRLDKNLKKANSILLLSREIISTGDLKQCLISFSNIYPGGKILLINVSNVNCEFTKEEYIINENLKILRYYFNDTYDEKNSLGYSTIMSWIGNCSEWSKVLENYKLN